MNTNNSVMAEDAQNWWATTPDGPLPVASTCTCSPYLGIITSEQNRDSRFR